MTAADWRTDHERREHDRDNGRSLALASALERAARILREPHDGLYAATCEQFLFALAGSPQDRIDAVNAWAGARRIPAKDRYVNADGAYCARLRDGQMTIIAMAVPVAAEGEALDSAGETELAVA